MFVVIDKSIVKFIWDDKGIRVAKTILKKKNEVEVVSVLNFKTVQP
jgi:hypothetical protein